MATKNAALRNKQSDDWRALWANGTLQVLNSDSTLVLFSFALGASPFAASSNGTVTLQGTPITTTASFEYSGQPMVGRLRSNGNTYEIAGLTVGLSGSGSQVIVSATSVLAGQVVNLNGMTYTTAATVV
jgi:hypothetical protein